MTSALQPQWVAFTCALNAREPFASSHLGVPTFRWENSRLGQSYAGYGVAGTLVVERPEQAYAAFDQLSQPGQFLWAGETGHPRPPGTWFGGLAFDPHRPRGDWWRGFPPSHWTLPRYLIWTQQGQSYLTGFQRMGQGRDPAVAEVREVRTVARRLDGSGSRPNTCLRGRGKYLNGVVSDRGAWNRLLRDALAAIQGGTLSKVVIARSVDLEGLQAFDVEQVFDSLRRIAPGSTAFLIRGTDGTAFVGASPELLWRCDGSLLETEALAGSASQANAAGLLQSDKENREHRCVVDGILTALGPFSDAVSVEGAPTLLGVPHLVHLRTPIRARLKEGSRISEVLAALHPTPAVGGTPKERALSFLAEHENLDRGWYGGAVGWVGEHSMELVVALRSALLRANRARLFVGAGIVEGSTEEGEWEETEAKGLTIREALSGGGSDALP